jgi:hypothetical protein
VKHILNLGVFLAVVVNLLPEDAGSIFPWNIGICPPQYRVSPFRILLPWPVNTDNCLSTWISRLQADWSSFVLFLEVILGL